MALPVYLSNFKAAGIYRVVFDKSTILGTDAEILRLVVGYSEQGPFNAPVYVTSVTDFKNIFGDVSKKLEKRGVFFHRIALQCLAAGPILCLNLKKFSDETVDGVSISSNYSYEHVYSEDIIDTVKLSVEDLYDTTRFWSLDATKLPELRDAENGRNLRNYVNIAATNSDKSGCSYFIRKANGNKVSAYNISVSDWYKDSNEDIPEYLEGKENNLISDFFAEIYVFKGEFKKEQVMSSETLKKYFDVVGGELQLKHSIDDPYGDQVDTLDYLYVDESAAGIAHYVGCLIPYFKDKQNVYRSLDILFNQDIDQHGLMMSFDIDHLTDADEEGHIHEIDLSGKYEVTNGMLEGIGKDVVAWSIPEDLTNDAILAMEARCVDMRPKESEAEGPKVLFGEYHVNDEFDVIKNYIDWTTRKDEDGSSDTQAQDQADARAWYTMMGERFFDGLDTLDDDGNVLKKGLKFENVRDSILEACENLKAPVQYEVEVVRTDENGVVMLNNFGQPVIGHETRERLELPEDLEDYVYGGSCDEWVEYMVEWLKYFVADARRDYIVEHNMVAKYTHTDLLGNINSPIVAFKTSIGSVTSTGTRFDLLYSTVITNEARLIDIEVRYPMATVIRIKVAEGNQDMKNWLSLRAALSVGTIINAIDFKDVAVSADSNFTIIEFGKKSSFVITDSNEDISTTSENINAKDLRNYVYDPSISVLSLGETVTFAESAGQMVIPSKAFESYDLADPDSLLHIPAVKDNCVYDTALAYLVSVGDIFVADAILEKDENVNEKEQRHDIVFVQEVHHAESEDEEGLEYVVFTGKPYISNEDANGDQAFTLFRINDSLNKEIGVMKPKYLAGYVYGNGEKGKDRPFSSTMNDKVKWQKFIMSTLTDYKGLRTGLLNKSDIDYRYIIDTFESYVTTSCKAELSYLAKEKQSAFAILNFPSVRSFIKCPYTSFTDEKGVFAVKYVVKGYNPKKAHSTGFGLPSNDEGASFCAFYTPMKMSDGYVDNIVPSAGAVSNLFMEKYLSRQPYYIVAGPNHGVINVSGLVGPDYNYSMAELNEIEPYGVNCLVYRPSFGTYINANQTAKQTPKSALSSVNVRELVIYLQDEIEKLLQSYQWEFNNATVRNKIKDRADVICTRIQQNGGIQAFLNIMDESNNTPEIIDNEMAILSTHIEPGRGMGKMVHELTIYRTGQMMSVINNE